MPTDSQAEAPESRSVPEVVAPTTKVNVALPFSHLHVEDSSKDLAELGAIVADLIAVVEGVAPGPEIKRLRERVEALKPRVP